MQNLSCPWFDPSFNRSIQRRHNNVATELCRIRYSHGGMKMKLPRNPGFRSQDGINEPPCSFAMPVRPYVTGNVPKTDSTATFRLTFVEVDRFLYETSFQGDESVLRLLSGVLRVDRLTLPLRQLQSAHGSKDDHLVSRRTNTREIDYGEFDSDKNTSRASATSLKIRQRKKKPAVSETSACGVFHPALAELRALTIWQATYYKELNNVAKSASAIHRNAIEWYYLLVSQHDSIIRGSQMNWDLTEKPQEKKNTHFSRIKFDFELGQSEKLKLPALRSHIQRFWEGLLPRKFGTRPHRFIVSEFLKARSRREAPRDLPAERETGGRKERKILSRGPYFFSFK
ncbi:hypothetical protein EVAR_61115_1 [Eumeta japonica]|uniref:Uncharacterized protein n=1 Tax=Eumeta variegata TaxID=151549 RepID=A0A4C1ZCW4_EUMVA|nr:hypothetical protein EVAR_61115_1 [Eumeta japonica]